MPTGNRRQQDEIDTEVLEGCLEGCISGCLDVLFGFISCLVLLVVVGSLVVRYVLA